MIIIHMCRLKSHIFYLRWIQGYEFIYRKVETGFCVLVVEQGAVTESVMFNFFLFNFVPNFLFVFEVEDLSDSFTFSKSLEEFFMVTKFNSKDESEIYSKQYLLQIVPMI